MTSAPATPSRLGLTAKLAGAFLLLTAITAAVGFYGLSRLEVIQGTPRS